MFLREKLYIHYVIVQIYLLRLWQGGKIMTIISLSDHGETPFEKILGHNVDILQAWSHLHEVVVKKGLLSATLKEQVRRTLAQQNGCEYCQAKGMPQRHLFDEKTTVAVAFAEVFLKEKGNVPSSAVHVLQQTFCDAEISELVAFITFITASQYVGAILKLS